MTRLLVGLTVLALAMSTGLAGSQATAASPTDWPAYEHGPGHSSAAFGDSAITTANVSTLHQVWSFTAAGPTQPGQPAARFDASATVVGGRVYIGARTGVFYALDAATGAVVWQKQL